MRKNIARTRIIVIGVATLVTLLAWFGSELYHKIVTNQSSSDVQAQTKPLTPKLQTQVLTELESKRSVPVQISEPENPAPL